MNKLVNAWYKSSPWLKLLKPLALLFRQQAGKRRNAYQQGIKLSWKAPVPVIVVGNITVGGVGKTPLVALLAQAALKAGYRPGIVSRGYGSKAPAYPFVVSSTSAVQESGDEPLMLARKTACPVVIDANRVAAAKYLLQHYDCDLIISDDGMQHYALGRDIEIAVVDGKRGLGNGMCLPAGPLREPPTRLQSVDFVVVNGEGYTPQQVCYRMQLVPCEWINLKTRERLPVDALSTLEPVHALAGIGNPKRFFDTLRCLGYRVSEHAFADHYQFLAADLLFKDGLRVMMTEKDAVKCEAIAHDQCWYLSVQAEIKPDIMNQLLTKLSLLSGKPESNNQDH